MAGGQEPEGVRAREESSAGRQRELGRSQDGVRNPGGCPRREEVDLRRERGKEGREEEVRESCTGRKAQGEQQEEERRTGIEPQRMTAGKGQFGGRGEHLERDGTPSLSCKPRVGSPGPEEVEREESGSCRRTDGRPGVQQREEREDQVKEQGECKRGKRRRVAGKLPCAECSPRAGMRRGLDGEDGFHDSFDKDGIGSAPGWHRGGDPLSRWRKRGWVPSALLPWEV